MNRHSTKTKRLKSSLRSKSFSDLDLKVQVKHVTNLIKKIKVRNVGFLKSSNEIKVLDLQRLSHTLPFESQSSVVRILKYVILRPSTTELCLKLILEDAYGGTIPIND